MIPAGYAVKLRDIPKAIVDKTSPPKDVAIEIIEHKIDRAALIELRAKLIARIEKIDKLLKTNDL